MFKRGCGQLRSTLNSQLISAFSRNGGPACPASKSTVLSDKPWDHNIGVCKQIHILDPSYKKIHHFCLHRKKSPVVKYFTFTEDIASPINLVPNSNV